MAFLAPLIEKNPSFLRSVWNGQGEMYRRSGDYRKALACFRRSIQEKPEQTDAYLLEGLTYWMMKDGARARQDWAKAASRNTAFQWLCDLR
jgi:tetratricopeptide (TPR) repeat protein